VQLPAASVAFVRDEAPIGHVVTLEEDGSADVTVAWFDVDEDGRLRFATLFDQRKLRNLRRDPRIVVSFERDRTTRLGMREYLVVEGEAVVTEGGAPALLAMLAQRYVGPGTRFPPMETPPPGFVTVVTPTRFRGVGPWDA
jgi:PPOX class probable F420-dependent enzyme